MLKIFGHSTNYRKIHKSLFKLSNYGSNGSNIIQKSTALFSSSSSSTNAILPSSQPTSSSSSSITNMNDHYNNHYIDSLQFYHTLRNCKDQYLSQHINHALDVLTDAYRLYGSNYLISSYNGGKDADVIMHLLRAVAAKYSFDHGIYVITN